MKIFQTGELLNFCHINGTYLFITNEIFTKYIFLNKYNYFKSIRTNSYFAHLAVQQKKPSKVQYKLSTDCALSAYFINCKRIKRVLMKQFLKHIELGCG